MVDGADHWEVEERERERASSNGTWLNGKRLKKGVATSLANGDTLMLINPAKPQAGADACPAHLCFTFCVRRRGLGRGVA